jgi:undecaprenyl-diphosphatase
MRRTATFITGAAALVGSGLAAARPYSEVEESAFHAINRMPSDPQLLVKTLMQFGTFGTVPAVAGIALARKDKDLALRIGLAGTAAWLGAKAIKKLLERGRPASLHTVDEMRGDHGGDHGWISGHSAVAVALAMTAGPLLPKHARPLLYPLAAAVGLGRIYVGAHEPLDVVGGAGFGMMLGSVFRR